MTELRVFKRCPRVCMSLVVVALLGLVACESSTPSAKVPPASATPPRPPPNSPEADPEKNAP